MKFLFLFLAFSICAQTKSPLLEMVEGSSIANLKKIKDPFMIPKEKVEILTAEKKTLKKNNIYSNELSGSELTLNNLIIVGVALGKKNRAIVKVKGKTETYMMTEGDLIGPDQIKLKAVLPSGVIFVEKSTNIYGTQEYFETVLPVTKAE